ncbi:MAG: DNA methyltransferase [Candidatus Hatepunaea meridiana]|nr:DNA methyltransferase [Candidatus Hatepunaea meridiana]
MENENLLYYGDNLDVLRLHIKDESVDLVYLDPPFKSDQNYNVIFREQDGTKSKSQIKAFEDTWHWDITAAASYQEVIETCSDDVSKAMQAFRNFLGESDMLAYLSMMAPRLVEMKRVLKQTGSIYLHCDPTASHYLKMLMDSIFGVNNFRNEIVWHYRTGNLAKKQFQRKHDIILFYSKSGNSFFKPIDIKEYYVQVYGPGFKPSFKGRKHGEDKYGQYRMSFIDDVWDISAVFTLSKEHLDYPTQKPEALLERIINASSKEGDIVLDPFCGCGTTIVTAQRFNRQWIGIDVTHLAVTLIKHRLNDMFGGEVKYKTVGEPKSLPDAIALAKDDAYQFQWWSLGLVGARPVEQKKGKDRGIDGRLYFHDEPVGGKTKQIIISVKSGHTGVAHIRDLRGVIEREKAEIGVLISLKEPTREMKKEAASAGFYESPWGKHPRMQILTITDIFDNKGIDFPPQTNVTYKKAGKANKSNQNNSNLF